MIAGAIGLWAFFGSNATAARIYLYTWPLRYLGAVVSALVSYGAAIRKTPSLQLAEALRFIFFLYYLKVGTYAPTVKGLLFGFFARQDCERFARESARWY